MPTGYTSEISKGISFEKFVLSCSRAFGALIMMRDEPFDAKIPDEFKPSDYHIKELKDANKKMSRLLELTPEEKEKQSEKSYQDSLAYWTGKEKEKTELRNQYNAMLDKVIDWSPPTEDHVGLKDFMVKQITDSIEWDCYESEPPAKLSPDDWYNKELESAQWGIDYHTKGNGEEIKRSKERTEWVRALKSSLNQGEKVA